AMNEEDPASQPPPAPDSVPGEQPATESSAGAPPVALEEFDLPAVEAAASAPAIDPAVAAGIAAGYVRQPVWWPPFAFAAALLVVGGVIGMAVGGAAADFMTASLEVLPFTLLALLAYLGVRHLGARLAAYAWLGVIVWATCFFVLLLTLASSVSAPL